MWYAVAFVCIVYGKLVRTALFVPDEAFENGPLFEHETQAIWLRVQAKMFTSVFVCGIHGCSQLQNLLYEV